MAAFRFRKKTNYGMAMLVLLCSYDGKYMSVSEMQDFGLPRSFLVKIAQDLIRADIIGSKEGRGGGYYLACDPEKTTLRDVIEALEGRVSIVSCLYGGECEFANECLHKGVMSTLSSDIESVLEKYTISDLC